MDDLIVEFLAETNENLEELDMDLVNLEQNPNDSALLGKIFRLIHTIKGTCGFLGLPRLEKVAHHGENVLGRFRDGDLEVTPEYVTLIFECLDTVKEIMAKLAETGEEPEGDDSALIAKLDAAYEGRSVEGVDGVQGDEKAAIVPDDNAPAEEVVKRGLVSQDELDALEAAFAAAPAWDGADEESSGEDTKEPETAEEVEQPEKVEPARAAAPPKAAAAPPPQKTAAAPPAAAQSLRVSVDVLEELMTMVSELVLTRNQLLQIRPLAGDADDGYSAPLQRLNHVVSDLQEGVMKTRMQPIGNAWAKLPRIVRDLAMELGKKIDLKMEGQETELDRQVLDLIKDPLTHMVRNSGDHGIESPETRKNAGKPETGTIRLNAYHEGGYIIIQIADDGKGLSTTRIRQKALENGLATTEELESMTDTQVNQFIFKAGFSTAEKVTSVSGRGVGMDVVRSNIEKIGGSIGLDTKEGHGSTFTIKIPLTLAIVSAIIVEVSGERFAIPQLSVRELVLTGSESEIEDLNGAPVLRLRNSLLPLVSLKKLLKLEDNDSVPPAGLNVSHESAAQEGDRSDSGDDSKEVAAQSGDDSKEVAAQSGDHPYDESKEYIVVTQIGSVSFGLIVDRVYDTQEIVVKPVAEILRNIDIFSGNTILGDGTVIMILDPNGIAQHIGDVKAVESQAEREKEIVASRERLREQTSLLLFLAGDDTPKAVPLALVSRLENIDFKEVEHSGHKMLVQYRGRLMPLVPFGSDVEVEKEGDKPVLVFAHHDKLMGLIVDEIIDIADAHIDIQMESSSAGLLGSAVINSKATDIIDVGYYLQHSDGKWFKNHGDEPFAGQNASVNGHANGAAAHANGKKHGSKTRVLLVDDSPFFRNMLSPLLSVAGYDVTSLESPQDALKMCEQGQEFDIIISDIEMPDMNGFEFAEKVRGGSMWQSTPMVALSSHATPEDIDRGAQVGFTNYVAKFDREKLLSTISQTLSEHKKAGQDNSRREMA